MKRLNLDLVGGDDVRIVSFRRKVFHANGKARLVTFVIDLDAIVRKVGRKALSNRTLRAGYLDGAVVAIGATEVAS